ncbi:MAG TPA: hypothetical protein DCF84_05345 [Bacteroidetes bacterium]|nr:hypothetical protein [Bacteroidota bacterium]|tara:strand:- start:743 stop:1252 length:510 start_codon:yes stop_codon:yes gene_type:complete
MSFFADELANISFIPLQAKHLELVRQWRNSSMVNHHMINQEHITKEQQQQWYQSRNSTREAYFIAQYLGDNIGMFYWTDVSQEASSIQTHGFIGETQWHKTPVSSLAIIAFYKLCFQQFDMVWGRILKTNKNFLSLQETLSASCTDQGNYMFCELDKSTFYSSSLAKLL